MSETMKKPRIRFKGFTEAWEQRKLGELGSLKNGMNFSKEAMGVGFPFVNLQNIFGNNVIDVSDLGKAMASESQLKDYNLLEGDALFVRSSVKLEGVGEAAIVPHNLENTTYSGFIIRFRDEYGLDNDFKRFVFGIESVRNQIMAQATNSANKNISQSVLENLDLAIPSKSEQQKIGAYFNNLDHLITLHQRKYDKLLNIKKSMLEKMFPKNGNDVPEIRFKGFTDAWEQRKVGDLLIERNQQAPMSDEYPLMAFIANEGVAPKGERYDRSALVTDTVNKLYKKTERGDFIYSSNNLETGSIGLNKYGKACISPVYSIFEPTGIADSDFLGRRLVRKDFINAMVKWRQGVIYGQWRIHESDFLKIEIPVPSVEEQRKIGAYLDHLDNLITLHQRKLEKLKNIKKSMLEKMFV